uniref:BLOT-like protein n=1 Tax=Leptinotarsa decemlineata TaxID=7539 RepID=X2D4J3_LEPDE|nr:BLOT-like protein [Leptinotarsa decemlineata]
MRGKWSNSQTNIISSPSLNLKHGREEIYKPKLLKHSQSVRAMKTYNEMPVDVNFQNEIDLCLFTPPKYDSASVSRVSIGSDNKSNEHNFYEYATVGTMSAANSGSEINSDLNEMGSTVKLVPSKMKLSCQTWMSYISTALCTISMALGLGNLYRLPQTTMIRGGLPFLIAHLILTTFIGLPLLFLELGIGQMAQEGFIKSWRAIPFFKGIGYVKFLAGCMLSIYYPLFMTLSLYYVIWICKGPIPFQECSAGVKMTQDGYSSYGKSGQQCLRATFLKPPSEDPYWYGVFAGILLMVWLTILSFGRTKSYIRLLLLLVVPTFGCFLALFVKSMMLQNDFDSLHSFIFDADWSLLKSANVWYYASIQVFFSTTVGFGSFVTNAGIIYNKVNPFWTALGYSAINVIFGVGSVFISQSMTNRTSVNISGDTGDVAEVHLVSLIYDIGIHSGSSDIKTWILLVHVVFILSGLTSMATLCYTLLKAITVECKAKKVKWWHASIVMGFIGFVLGCAVLLQPNFDIVHLLDHYIVGNLILITAVVEVMAMIAFYGTERIRSDFEFMLGHILSGLWLLLWWAAPLILTGLFAWGMITLPMEGIFREDPPWLYLTGWGVVLVASLFIFIKGVHTVHIQDGYTWKDKFKASLKPSKKWGPSDPISRHTWIQWNTKAQHGERDFTLKRKGTKDYTKSIKKNKKLNVLAQSSVDGIYKENNGRQSIGKEGSHIYAELIKENRTMSREPAHLRVTSLTDSFEVDHPSSISSNRSLRNDVVVLRNEIPEQYGTFRKGPYIISNNNVEHVCFRRNSDRESATEL